MKNRQKFRLTLLMLLGMAAVLDSCLDTPKSETDSNAAITSMKIGTFEVKVRDLNSKRRDTVLYVKHSGAEFPLTIDQVNNTIYNLDSIPKEAILTKVAGNSIGAEGFVFFKDNSMEAYKQWKSADSINLNDTVFWRVASTDGTFVRDYTLVLNVSKTFPDSMTWKKADDYGWGGMASVTAAVNGDKLYVLGRDLDRISVVATDLKSCARVVESAVSGLPAYEWSGSVVAFGGKLYTVAGSSLYASENGIDWTDQSIAMKSLLRPGCAMKEMWAVGTDGNLKVSTDMATWENFCAVPAEFPDSVADIVQYKSVSNPGITRSVVMGYGADNKRVAVWTRLSTDDSWSKIEPGYNTHLMPAKRSLSMFLYDKSLFAFGDMPDGFYQSQDNGINWRFCDSYVDGYDSWNRFMQVPEPMRKELGVVSCCVDQDNYLWLVNAYGMVWKGIINRLRN